MNILATPSCNDATLAPYVPSSQDPWNTIKVNHVYRRLGFGAIQSDIDAALALTPDEFIDSLVDTAASLPVTPEPFWAYYSVNDFVDFETENNQYINDWRLKTGDDIWDDGVVL